MQDTGKIIDLYAKKYATRDLQYMMMGMILDHEFLKARFQDNNISSAYIYGNDQLAIQLYTYSRTIISVRGVICEDKILYRDYKYGWKLEIDKKDAVSYDDFLERGGFEPAIIIISDLGIAKCKENELRKRMDCLFINEFLFGGINNALQY